jgi:tetratricopeptide (TPR) repeat protein
MRTYEASLHAYPGLQRARRGMAEMVLRCGGNPQQALEYVENMKSGAGLSWAVRRMGKRQQDDYWSLKAWALAQLGRSAEVAPAIEAAFKATNKKSRPDLAVTNYRAGMAMRAIGNESAAADYFRRARDLDPNGRRGSLAQAALAERSAWGAGV